MKTIIISDIHNRVDWIEDFLISFQDQYNNVIFLGDYFDDYNDSLEDIYIAANWLKQSLKKSNRIHLNGTHDLWYRFPYNPFIEVSGNTGDKEKVINSIISPSDWDKLKLFYYDNDSNYLISHAGVHRYLISDYVFKNMNIFRNQIISSKNNNNSSLNLSTKQIIDKIIKPATEQALEDVRNGKSNMWLEAGFSRGGLQPVGGIIWLDWDKEFEPIPNINQIVGHTEHSMPVHKNTIDSKNYDLDTKNLYIGLLENSTLNLFENNFF